MARQLKMNQWKKKITSLRMPKNKINMGTTSTRSSKNNTSPTIKEEISFTTYVRRAKHAGSWYSSSSKALEKELSNYLAIAALDKDNDSNHAKTKSNDTTSTSTSSIPCGIIAPHAGYSYSGSTAAYAYIGLKEALEQQNIKTIIVLHPSHYMHLDGCAISGMLYTLVISLERNYLYYTCFFLKYGRCIKY